MCNIKSQENECPYRALAIQACFSTLIDLHTMVPTLLIFFVYLFVNFLQSIMTGEPMHVHM